MRTPASKFIASGVALGAGLGGFVDGIVAHQLLQAHNMLSARYPTKDLPAEQLVIHLEINMFWDGLFHVMVWVLTVLGLTMMFHTMNTSKVRFPSRMFYGSLLSGWGAFNLIEGVIDHHILQIHHVKESRDHLWWDLGFLASGLVLVLAGAGLIKSSDGTRKAQQDLPLS